MSESNHYGSHNGEIENLGLQDRMVQNRLYWSSLRERGVQWGPAALAFVYRVFGRRVCLIVLWPVIVYFYLSGRVQRNASRGYLQRIWRVNRWPGKPGHWQSLQHFFAFGSAMLDKLASWIGHIPRESIEGLDGSAFDEMRADPAGALILSAHIGNVEIVRALAARHQKRQINVIIHTGQAENFNRLITRFAPHSSVRLIAAAEVGVATAMFLSAAVERGEWVVIMGDRTPVNGTGRTLTIPFLGAPAQFPLGPFLLINALKCQTYLLMCYKRSGRYRIRFSRFTQAGPSTRGEKGGVLQALAQKYALVLEEVLREAPLQWFNFYDYWGEQATRGVAATKG